MANADDLHPATARADDALFPRRVRRWLLLGLAALLLSGVYLISVRGTAILFDLTDAVKSFCF